MSALLTFTLPLFFIGMVLMVAGSRRQPRDVQVQRALKLVVFCVIVHVVLAIILVIPSGAFCFAIAIFLLGGYELSRTMPSLQMWIRSIVFALATTMAVLWLLNTWFISPTSIAFCFLVCAIFDGFSQVIGQWLGRHLLMPKISPAKTVEGLLGGVIASVTLAVVLHSLAKLSVANAALMGGVIAVGAFCGDTVGSWIKRKAGIKDFSSILPGQGGILDRFNSFVFGLIFASHWLQ